MVRKELANDKAELAEFKKRQDAVEADYEDWSILRLRSEGKFLQ